MNFTRRDFAKLALAAMPATPLGAAKPDSKWGGVQVGINAPYSFTRMSGTADKILEYMTQLNLSAAELRLQPVEAYLNAPGVYASANDAPGRAGAAPDRACRRPWTWPGSSHSGATGCGSRCRRGAAQVASGAFDGPNRGFPQDTRTPAS